MRKSLIAVIAALCVVGLSAVAYAQYAPPSHTMTADISPNVKNKSARATIELRTGTNDQSTVSNFTFLFPKQIKVNPAGFKYCTVNTIVKAGNVDSKCPRGSKVGFGTAEAYVGSRSGKRIDFDTTIYAGSSRSLTIYLVGKGDFSTIKRAFSAVLKSASGSFRQALSTDIPKDIQFVGGVTPVVLSQVKISIKATRTLSRGRSAKILVKTGPCPSNKQWLLGTKLTYSRPAGAVSSATASVKCR